MGHYPGVIHLAYLSSVLQRADHVHGNLPNDTRTLFRCP